MAVTAGVSMWVNNSATTVMMLPIALAVLTATVGTPDGTARAATTAMPAISRRH
jgi:hypothetical protein